MLMPLLSEADPQESAEGSIDPLGTYAIADALAVRMVPGVRERQQHPRFLTTIAVSLSLCSDFDDEVVAKDGVSEPWQVFEWYVVEGLVRSTPDQALLRGLPGRDKALKAIDDKVPLSQRRYLKGPATFGFHGVYRGLARDIGIEQADRLGDQGYELLRCWEEEQGLQGFCGSGDGPGKSRRRRLVEGIVDGLVKGATDRKSWGPFFCNHLGIYNAGDREAEQLRLNLTGSNQGYRGEIFDALTSTDGRELWRNEAAKKNPSERRFHEALAGHSSPGLDELLGAIDHYEWFSRYLQDAFDDCLRYLSQHQQRIKPSELAGLDSVKTAADQIPEIFTEVSDRISPFGQVTRFQESFSELAQRTTALQWLELLLDHHTRIQRSKRFSMRRRVGDATSHQSFFACYSQMAARCMQKDFGSTVNAGAFIRSGQATLPVRALELQRNQISRPTWFMSSTRIAVPLRSGRSMPPFRNVNASTWTESNGNRNRGMMDPRVEFCYPNFLERQPTSATKNRTRR